MAERSAEQLLADAEGFVEELRQRSIEIDEARQVPQDIVERMAERGFYRMCAPVGLGGTGTDPAVQAEVCEILGRGNGSAAWCVFIGASSQYSFVGLDPAQLAIVLDNPNVVTSGVFATSGTAVPAEHDGQPGFVVNGSWTWGSGCHNAQWISGGVRVDPTDGDPYEARAYFLPPEIDIEDNWHTAGLRGTGSSTYHAHDLWLAQERVTDPRRRSPHADEPIYRFPQFAVLCAPIGSLCLGMARGSIDEVLQIAAEKTPTGSRRTLGQRALLHRDVAVADTKLRAARSLLYDELRSTWQHVETERPTIEHRRLLRTAVVHAVSTAAEVIDRMHTVVGGSSVFEDSCLQRNLRDVHVATQHMMVAEPVMELAGRVMLGLDDTAPGL